MFQVTGVVGDQAFDDNLKSEQEPEEPKVKQVKHEVWLSPVVVQHVNGRDDILPTSMCLPCRFDQAGKCASASIVCSADGSSVTESLWTEEACKGPPQVVSKTELAMPAAPGAPVRMRCPNADFSSPWKLDLSRFVAKLQKDQPSLFPDEGMAVQAIEEYRRMLHLAQTHPSLDLVPSAVVDQVWHSHILDTRAYKQDMTKLFGRYMEHVPSFEGDSESKVELKQSYVEMLKHYEEEYGPASQALWPHQNANAPVNGQVDSTIWLGCCSAWCVKPSCTSCVGCSATYCGTMGHAGLPGYVPL